MALFEFAESIAQSFADAGPIPTDILASDAVPIDEGEIGSALAGKRWQDVETFRLPWLIGQSVWLTTEAFLYYLPSFIVATLKAENQEDLCSLIFYTCRRANRSHVSLAGLLKTYSSPQLAALGLLFGYVMREDICHLEQPSLISEFLAHLD